MTWHVVYLTGPTDEYVPEAADSETILRLPMDSPSDDDSPRGNIREEFQRWGLVPHPAADEFLRLALAAYTADTRIPRRAAFDGWSRDIKLHFPISDRTAWEGADTEAERLLEFLTGDRWTLVPREVTEEYRLVPAGTGGAVRIVETRRVSLFSGGLDSAIGALDQQSIASTLLLSHYALGQGSTSKSQGDLMALWSTVLQEPALSHIQFHFTPRKGMRRNTENTTRGRSIMFLALGIAAASAIEDAELIVPENGFISLNVPMTIARSSSFSTRTTHPHLIQMLRSIMRSLGIPVRVHLPYRFKTKGEMLRECGRQDALAASLSLTNSCAHPSAGRFVKGARGIQHCGYCYPCLIRRAATSVWGDDTTDYAVANPLILTSVTTRADIRAVRLCLDRYTETPPRLSDLLRAGPLPGSGDEKKSYLGVYERGLREIRQFVESLE